MFDHSIKVPRLYKIASKVSKEVSEGRGSIKQLVYECKHPNIKALYALVANTFQRSEDIEKLLKKSKLLTKEPRFDPWLAKILITELLWGKKRLTGESKPVKTILGYEQIFKAHMSDVEHHTEDLQQGGKPRYVRINTLKTTVNEAVEMFRDEGWSLKRYNDVTNYFGFLNAVANLRSDEFMVDLHIPYLLIFPPKTQFYKHAAYRNGNIILQDKASCLPAHILNPKRGATILDMCAAPGMKTTQTGALIENDGLIYAVEIGTKRFHTLTKIIETSGATCVKPINRDVTTITDKDCPGIEYILVDPSCSGSGLTDRVEIGHQRRDQHNSRLNNLAAFQITLLRYALTKFPKAKRVVYSTCSIYPEENEDVVRQVLETCTKFKLVPANTFVNNVWTNFGSPEFGDIGTYCLYAKPDIDLTSGFFVAIFERLEKGESNQFLNFQLFPVQKQIGRKKKTLQNYLDRNDQDECVQNKEGFNETESIKKRAEDIHEEVVQTSPKKKKKKFDTEISQVLDSQATEIHVKEEQIREEKSVNSKNSSMKKKKKHKYKEEMEKFESVTVVEETEESSTNSEQTIKKKKKKHKIKLINEDNESATTNTNVAKIENDEINNASKSKKKNKTRKMSG